MFHHISDGFSGFLKLWWRRKPLVRDYTPKNAYAIQKQACQKFSIREQSFTPPYLLIAASLNTAKSEYIKNEMKNFNLI